MYMYAYKYMYIHVLLTYISRRGNYDLHLIKINSVQTCSNHMWPSLRKIKMSMA